MHNGDVTESNIPALIVDDVDLSDTDRTRLKLLLCTANVGSLFEKIDEIFPGWLREFEELIERRCPHFVALHMQEVGGKDYEQSMENVDEFVKQLISSPSFSTYSRFCVFLNTDFTDQADFTALGSIYFISDQLDTVELWEFNKKEFVMLEIPLVFAGNNSTNSFVDSHKFDREFFPESKWSRKGYLHTKWKFGSSVLHFVNIHLFHDASNFPAAEKVESDYSIYRANALRFAIERLGLCSDDTIDMAIFGDFNFRISTLKFIKEMKVDNHQQNQSESVTNHSAVKIRKDSGPLKIRLANDQGEIQIKKKSFMMDTKANKMFRDKYVEIRKFDNESIGFQSQLQELEIVFPPTYPYSEDVTKAIDFLGTRCPSWCDRILLTPRFLDNIKINGEETVQQLKTKPDYGVIGQWVCMGDHKPVYLYVGRSDIWINTRKNEEKRLSMNQEYTNEELNQRQSLESFILNSHKCGFHDSWTIHDYALFRSKELLGIPSIMRAICKDPDDMTGFKRLSIVARSRKINSLWTKIRAVTMFVGAAHRRGSWYTTSSSDSSAEEIELNMKEEESENDGMTVAQSDSPTTMTFNITTNTNHDDVRKTISECLDILENDTTGPSETFKGNETTREWNELARHVRWKRNRSSIQGFDLFPKVHQLRRPINSVCWWRCCCIQ